MIDPILFKLACNDDIHNNLDEFKFQPDWTTDCMELATLKHLKSPHRFIMALR